MQPNISEMRSFPRFRDFYIRKDRKAYKIQVKWIRFSSYILAFAEEISVVDYLFVAVLLKVGIVHIRTEGLDGAYAERLVEFEIGF